MKKVLIIGGVAGGATAAGRIRRLDPHAKIVMFERGAYMSFANCGLPYGISGVVEEFTDLLLVSPEDFASRYQIDIRLEQEITQLDTTAQQVTVHNHKTGEDYTESYDKLVLSMGAAPTVPPFPGGDLPGVFRLRGYGDALVIKEYIAAHNPKRAVVVGGGFIGLEMVESFRQLGLAVTLIQRGSQIFAPLDEDMVSPIQTELEANQVILHKEASVSGITQEPEGLVVHTKEGLAVGADLVLLSLGVRPDSSLAQGAGIETNARGAIVTNQRMETSAPNVYAIGDVVEVRHLVSGQPTSILLAGPAHQQARVAASNLCGDHARYRGSQGSSILKVFGLDVAATGLNSAEAEAGGYAHDSALITSISHAGYYPGAEPFTMKVVYEQFTGRILGAQVVGRGGVDKRCDTLATAIFAGLTAWDLEDLQLCYAPPYAIPREAVNIIGGMIADAIEKKVATTQCVLLPNLKNDPSQVLLDLRVEEEFAAGHVAGAQNLPFAQLAAALAGLDTSKSYYLFCETGRQSAIATRMLTSRGLTAHNVCGGWQVYQHLDAAKLGGED